MTRNILNSLKYLSDMRTYISETERKRGQWNKATAYYADFLLDSYIERSASGAPIKTQQYRLYPWIWS